MKHKPVKDYSEYTVTVKTDCSYWGDDVDQETADQKSTSLGSEIDDHFPGITVRYCCLIGHGHRDETTGPDDDVCNDIDDTFSSLMECVMGE